MDLDRGFRVRSAHRSAVASAVLSVLFLFAESIVVSTSPSAYPVPFLCAATRYLPSSFALYRITIRVQLHQRLRCLCLTVGALAGGQALGVACGVRGWATRRDYGARLDAKGGLAAQQKPVRVASSRQCLCSARHATALRLRERANVARATSHGSQHQMRTIGEM